MKKTLMILCGLIMSLSAFAQTSVTVSGPHMTRDAQKTIIKERPNDYNATITCSNSKQTVTFIHSSYLMQATEVTLEDYNVNDMYVTHDSVYFCGVQLSTGWGMIGAFDIHDFFTNSGQAQIITNLSSGEEEFQVNELTRLDYHIDNFAYRHLFCIGTCGEKNYSCLVDWLVDMNVCSAGHVTKVSEVFTDVKIVRNRLSGTPYLATVGYDSENGQYLNVRVYEADNVFSPAGPQDWCHVYCFESGSTTRQWIDGGVLLARIDNDTFATVSYRKVSLQSGRDDTIQLAYGSNIHLGFFDLNAIVANSVYGMVDSYEIPLGLTYGREMQQFVYSRNKKSMVFLHTYNHSVMTPFRNEYCEFFPALLPSVTTLQAYTHPGTRHYGLANYMLGNKYILSGHKISTPTTLMYQMNTYGTFSECAEPIDYTPEQGKEISSWIFERRFSHRVWKPEINAVEGGIEYLPLYIECETE